MRKASVNYDNCKYCKKCLATKACPTKALFRLDDDEPVAVDLQLCYACGKCIAECPFNTIYLKEF